MSAHNHINEIAQNIYSNPITLLCRPFYSVIPLSYSVIPLFLSTRTPGWPSPCTRWTPDPWAVMANDSVRENTGPSVSASHTHAATIAAHPERDMFLSGELGSSTDLIWI